LLFLLHPISIAFCDGVLLLPFFSLFFFLPPQGILRRRLTDRRRYSSRAFSPPINLGSLLVGYFPTFCLFLCYIYFFLFFFVEIFKADESFFPFGILISSRVEGFFFFFFFFFLFFFLARAVSLIVLPSVVPSSSFLMPIPFS